MANLVIDLRQEYLENLLFYFSTIDNTGVDILTIITDFYQYADKNVYLKLEGSNDSEPPTYFDKIKINEINVDSVEQTLSFDYVLTAKSTAYRRLNLQVQIENSEGDFVEQSKIAEIVLDESVRADHEIEDTYPSVLTDLQRQIDEEVETRSQADIVLTDAIETEISERQSADSELSTAIATEQSRAEGVESQLSTAISNRYTKAETDALLNAKQDIIDNNHKLPSDLVDDTNQTNKFVSANEKAQITTNKNDIATEIVNRQTADDELATAIRGKQDTLTETQLNAVNSGITAELVGDIQANTTARHTHSNKSVLDNTTASFTTALKDKLDSVESNAQVNVLEGVKVNNVDLPISNKKVNVVVPTKTSDLQNDSGFITKSVDDLTNYTNTSTLNTLLSQKQDVLTFDDTPTSDSNNPVKSSGIKSYVDTYGGKIDSISINGTNQPIINKNVDLPAYPTKASLGLNNVDNTSDLDKPISTATQSALDLKADTSDLENYVDLTNAQTITGEKTFKGGVKIGNSTSTATPQILLDSSDRIAFYFGNNPKVKMGQLDTLFANRITPDSSNTYDIGRSGVYWRDLYLSGAIKNANGTFTLPSTSGTLALISEFSNYYNKTETDTLLGAKQNTIDSNNMLSSDLVDDTNKTHKFATASQLSQIATNQTNIANEIERATGVESDLSDDISDVASDLATETTNRQNNDATLQNNINAEANTRATNDTTIDNKLDYKVHIEGDTDELSYNGDNVVKTSSWRNLKSGATGTRQETIQLANDTTAGLMSHTDYQQIRDNTSRIENLEAQTTRLLYTDNTNPTQAQIQAFVDDYLTARGISPITDDDYIGIAVVVAGTYHIWRFYENDNIGWKDDGLDTVSQFSNEIAGIILGKQQDGFVYAENDGTGSVYGWSALKTRVSNVETGLSSHTSNTSNPHNVSKSQVGLGNVDNTSDLNKPISTATQTALNLKADKSTTYTKTEVDGLLDDKQDNLTTAQLNAVNSGITSTLVSDINSNTSARHTHSNKTILDNTTASFTTALQTKLNGIESGANVNVIESIKVNGTAQTITSKAVDIAVPTKTSDLTNDSGFISDLSSYYTKTETDDLLDDKVDKVSGKGLSTNDFTNTYKSNVDSNTSARHTHSNKSILDNITSAFTTEQATKLSGIESGAEVNDISTIKVNGVAQTITSKAVDISVPTNTNQLTNGAGFITKSVSDLTNYTKTSDLSAVATSGSYNDLSDKPTIPTATSELTNDSGFLTSHQDIKVLDTTNSTAQTTSSNEAIKGSGTIKLHKVSKTGNYNDLLNLPTIPTSVGDLTNDRFVRYDTASQGLNTTQQANARTNIGAGTSNFSGNYNDLTNKPTIPSADSDLTNDKYVAFVSQSLSADQKTQARTNIGAGTSDFTGYTSSNKLSTDYINNVAGWTSNTGSVVSVSAGTGLSISGTASVSPTINVASGYKLPTTTEWANKLDAYTIALSTGGSGVIHAKFMTIDYTDTTSEYSTLLKVSMVSAHGNATSYRFLQDVIISVQNTGSVSVVVYKQFGASAGTIDSVARQYGDIYYVIDTTNKIVDFYVLVGQYSQVNSTPYMRLGKALGGTITQYSGSATQYSSGTRTWGTGGDYVLKGDLANYQTKVSALGSTTKPVYISASGTFSESDTYAGGTKITLNGTAKGGTNATIYAPTSAITTSTAKQYLVGSASSTSVAEEHTNTSCYMSGGELYSNGYVVALAKDIPSVPSAIPLTDIDALFE